MQCNAFLVTRIYNQNHVQLSALRAHVQQPQTVIREIYILYNNPAHLLKQLIITTLSGSEGYTNFVSNRSKL